MNPLSDSQDPRRIETVIEMKDFATLSRYSIWKKELLDTLLETLKKRLGIELLVRVPENLRDTHPILFKNLGIISSLEKQGLVKKVSVLPPIPDEPPLHRIKAEGNLNASGAHFLDPEKALWSALGECVERSLWVESSEWYEGRTKKSSYKDLEGKKLDPRAIAGFSEEQKTLDSLFQVDTLTPLGWIEAKEWISGKNTWVPLQLLSAKYCKEHQKKSDKPDGDEPLLRSPITTGLATSSNSLEEATLYGALEIIERDAFMISWLNRLSPPRINLDHLVGQDEDIEKIINSLKNYRLRVELLLLPTDFPFPVVAAILIDETGNGPALSIGAKAHWNLKSAILGSLSEAASLRYSLKSTYRSNIDTTQMGKKERMLYWAKEENASQIAFFIQGELRKVTLDQNKENEAEVLSKLLNSFREKGYPVYVAEISSKASKKLGFRTAYVLIPELQPLHLDERLPALGGKRLKDVPALLGYETATDINRIPHPFP